MVESSELGGFTGSSVVKESLANTGAIGWILGPEKSTALSNKSPCTTTTEPVL